MSDLQTYARELAAMRPGEPFRIAGGSWARIQYDQRHATIEKALREVVGPNHGDYSFEWNDEEQSVDVIRRENIMEMLNGAVVGGGAREGDVPDLWRDRLRSAFES